MFYIIGKSGKLYNKSKANQLEKPLIKLQNIEQILQKNRFQKSNHSITVKSWNTLSTIPFLSSAPTSIMKNEICRLNEIQFPCIFKTLLL